jgi:hypothetical protein
VARDFDGATDYATATGVPQVGTGTIACWIWIRTLPGASNAGMIMTFYEESQTEEFGTHDKQLILGSDGLLYTRIYDGAVKSTTGSTVMATSTWYHTGLSIDGTNLKGWVNGVNEGSVAAGASFTGYTNPSLRLCGLTTTLGLAELARERHDGRIADFAIWSAALSTGEFAALAKGVSPLRIRPASLVAYYPLFGAGSAEPDAIGQSGNLVLNGTVQAAHAPVMPPFGADEWRSYAVGAGAALYLPPSRVFASVYR